MKILAWLMAALLSAPLLAASAPRASERMPEGAYFRHVTPDGVVHLNRTLTSNAIETGYQLIDGQGRVLETVEGVKLNDEKARAQRLRQARQQRADQELLRLYAGPDDAVRARDRKVDALELAISYEQNNLAQLQVKLDDEIAVAASNERAGREVPKAVKDAIDRLQRQLAQSKQKLKGFAAEIDEAEKEYTPIIQRLEAIRAGK